jgi:hypothetical protein
LTNKLTIGAMLIALGLGGIGTANAQPIYVAPRMYEPSLPPYEIVAIVRSAGLAPLTRPVRRGQAYVLVAGTRNGGQMRVVVDAYEGDILRVTPVGVMRPYGATAPYPYDPRARMAPVGPEIKDPPRGTYRQGAYGPNARYDGVPPIPPRAIPNSRLANAPPGVAPHAVVKPAQPPLPRARPGVAANQASTPPTPVAPPPAVAPVQPQAVPAARPQEASPPRTDTPTLVPVAPLE